MSTDTACHSARALCSRPKPKPPQTFAQNARPEKQLGVESVSPNRLLRVARNFPFQFGFYQLTDLHLTDFISFKLSKLSNSSPKFSRTQEHILLRDSYQVNRNDLLLPEAGVSDVSGDTSVNME